MKKLLWMFILLISLCGCYYAPGIPESSGGGSWENSSGTEKREEAVSVPTDEELLSGIESAKEANPWGETQSLSVATEWAGLDFTPPPEKLTLKSGEVLEMTMFRYKTGTVEALYRGEDYELTVRKSSDTKGEELAGDPDAGSAEWEEKNGALDAGNVQWEEKTGALDAGSAEWEEKTGDLSVYCRGERERVNAAWFDRDGEHFSITCYLGKEGQGLPLPDLFAIIEEITGLPQSQG